MRYIDVCSGISAPTMAWKPLGWEALCFAEIEAAPRAILGHHYPDVPLNGDFTKIKGNEYGPVDLLVGGTPCQSFSVAGLRGGMADERGNLALEFLKLADRARPRWVVWENVPGVLSSNDGRDFGAFLGGLAQLGYGWSYRVLDAQHFGVPQRRRRVFVVGHLGDWRRATAVLFERHSLSGNFAPRRQAGKVAPTIPSRSLGGGGLGTDFDCDGGLVSDWPADVCPTLDTYYGDKMGLEDQHVFNQRGGKFVRGYSASDYSSGGYEEVEQSAPLTTSADRTRAAPIAFSIMPMNSGKDYKARETDIAQPIMAGGPVGGNQGGDFIAHPVSFAENQRGELFTSDVTNALAGGGGKPGQGYAATLTASAVRRLTPRECERLQGFPDDFTLVPYRGRMMADGPRYKALGNSMAVPVLRWIGERIAKVDALQTQAVAA